VKFYGVPHFSPLLREVGVENSFTVSIFIFQFSRSTGNQKPVGTATSRPMIQRDQGSTATPLFSIVIPVFNDWVPLEECLESLTRQISAPSFEIIIVDDGSAQTAPDFVHSSSQDHTVTLIRQSHAGVSAARNLGIRVAKGAILLFVDADCKLESNCLAALASTIARFPEQNCFQLCLVGDHSSLVGRAEQLRLITFQNHTLQPDGRIRYLNTAGFAIRRAKVDIEVGLFEPVALRAEDTLLLATLIERGELPLFVHEAIVEHSMTLSLIGAIKKDIWSVYLEGTAYDMIAAKGVTIRVTHRERVRLLWSTWKTAGQRSIGHSAWFVLMVRQTVQRTVATGFHWLRVKPAAHA
jgi:glycosyltransferase involved in cell wall biosynthesis